MSRLIDADALERDGWHMSRTVRVDKDTMEMQTRKPTDFPTVEPQSEQRWIPVTERLPEGGCNTAGREIVLLSQLRHGYEGERMTHLAAFILGAWFGMFVAALCVAAREEDGDN